MKWQIFTDADAVTREACRIIGGTARRAIADRGRFGLVLAGGTTPAAAYRLLAATDQAWDRWEIWFGDERCLPPNNVERNSRMAAEALLNLVPIPEEQIHPMPTELGPEEAARRYTAVITAALPFDLVLLGMGDDGHTASLFPGRPHDETGLVHAVYEAPKPPPERVSLGLSALRQCGSMLVLITGAGKRKAVSQWRDGTELPVAQVTAGINGLVMLDEAAAPIQP